MGSFWKTPSSYSEHASPRSRNSFVMVFLATPVTLTVDRMLMPPTRQETTWPRRSVESLFMLTITPTKSKSSRVRLIVTRPRFCVGVGIPRLKLKSSATILTFMDPALLNKSPVGQLIPIQGTDARYGPYACFAFFPEPLPDEVALSMASITEVTKASSSLARLDQACDQLLDPALLIRPALYREALDTSALEGTYGQLTEILEAQLPGVHFRSPETREILGYVQAAYGAFAAVETQPISVSLLNAAQATMFAGVENPVTCRVALPPVNA